MVGNYMNSVSIAVSVQNLSIVYGESDRVRFALQGVSFDLVKGSWTTIVGANGSGKSTLAKVIAGLVEPNDGHIIKAEDTRIHIVLQNPETQILGDTIYEEMNLSLRDIVTVNLDPRQRVRSIVDEVGLSLSLDTPTNQLSGGEKQLLNIAACMAAGANVFVLDEVTSMLDYASRDRVIDVIQKLNNKGATILWCTHRSEEISYAERVIVLEKGCISYTGSSRQFLYGDPLMVTSSSPCEQWGMELPYVVQIVKQLEQGGYSLHEQPLLPQELSEAIKLRCQ
jgi:energy-coupling factor transport system ATP-binding protein